MFGIDAASLVGVGGLSFILVFIIVSVVRGGWIPSKTHKAALALAEEHTKQAREDRDAQIKEARQNRDAQITAIRDEVHLRMEAFRSDHALRMDQAREDHAKQLAALAIVTDGVRADFAAILRSKDGDIDQWRGAWQITDQAGRVEIAGQLDEIVAFTRVFKRFMDEFQHQTGVPELDTPDRR